ncbi:FkbM family methyltransferase [Massilia horti]|uniref:FkbM family methyltransferase n=1 Tax=Massilia horti TaxID=2562153 RepID=A0A4Y9SVE5_9BURK|nr:FkbM family methyltransferase [Massilia horti]TFW30408.1 FkbM family methyltransferase [Massilia horti]
MNSFVSYAQNFEDVLLWRALGHVKNGFYIDVGANDPVEHSVTKAFYDRGWTGINIEPLPHFYEAFLKQRPNDINLPIAAGAKEDFLTLYDVPAVRGWASPDPGVAAAHRAHGFQVTELTVQVRPVSSVCLEEVKGEVHFLKIDVEGFEGEVLRGMDFARWRPWVLVIEATLPNSRVTNHETWEHLVTGPGYHFAWFDGLNRYYVAQEHLELLPALQLQPNVFDEFVTAHLARAWEDTRKVARKLRESEAHAVVWATEAHDALERAGLAEQQRQEAQDAAFQTRVEAAAAIEAAKAQAAADTAISAGAAEQANAAAAKADANAQRTAEWARAVEQELIALRASRSWKVTRPLRTAAARVRALRRPGLARRIVIGATSNERLRRLIIPLLVRHPVLGRVVSARLQAIKQASPYPTDQAVSAAVRRAAEVPEALRHLPPSVRAVLADLQRARGNHTGS